MAREIKPTPVLEGQDVIEFYKKLASFKDDLKKLGITREKIERDAAKFRAMFKKRIILFRYPLTGLLGNILYLCTLKHNLK